MPAKKFRVLLDGAIPVFESDSCEEAQASFYRYRSQGMDPFLETPEDLQQDFYTSGSDPLQQELM